MDQLGIVAKTGQIRIGNTQKFRMNGYDEFIRHKQPQRPNDQNGEGHQKASQE